MSPALVVFLTFFMICYVLFFISKILKPDKGRVMKEDHFTVSVPRASLVVMLLFVFTSGSLASFALYLIPRVSFHPSLLWAVFVILFGIAIYLIYGVIYYMSYETQVKGNEIRHKEIFYPEFSFTFDDIRGARYGRRVGNLMLILSNSTEVLLEAEDHFAGFDLLVSSVEKNASVRIEEKDIAENFFRKPLK